MKFSYNINFKAYKEIYLIVYSAGVFIAGLIKDKLPTIKKSIALNGNPLMFDKHFGIKDEVLKVFRGLNLSNYMQFRRDYLVFSDKEFEYFNEHSSNRDFESCFIELDNLERLSKTDFEPYEFDIAILSDKDNFTYK